MARPAQQDQVVKIGAPLGRCMPRNDVVGLASLEGRAAEHAAPVPHHQRQELSCRSVAAGPAQPQRLPIQPNNHGREVGTGSEFGHELVADRTAPELGGRSPAGVATTQVAKPDGDHDRRARAGRAAMPNATIAVASEPVDGCVEAALVEGCMLTWWPITTAGVLIGPIGVGVQQRPDLIDQRIRALDANPGQRRLRATGGNRVATHTPSRHLCLISGVGIGGGGLLLQVVLHQTSCLIGVKPAGQIQQIRGDLACGLVGCLGQRVDPVATQPSVTGLFPEPGVGGQHRGSAGVSVDGPVRPAPSPTRQMGSSPPALRTRVTLGTGEPGNRQQPGRLQPLLKPGRQ